MKPWWQRTRNTLIIIIAVFGPGLITAFADNDAGGVATYSTAAAKFGYLALTTLIPITLVLAITQEIGARIAIVSGKGLADLIRERFGIKITIFVFICLFLVNFGVVIQDVGGLQGGLHLFGLNEKILTPFILLLLFYFIIKANYKKIEKFLLVLICFYLTYLISAVLAKPDWGLAAKSLIMPTAKITPEYLYTSIAVLGTTVTAWGQFFINSYVKDKHVNVNKLKYSQWEIYIGAILTNVFSLFMIVAVAATIFVHNIGIKDAADASLAIRPFAGDLAGIMFGFGLIVAGLIGLAIVPLATAYAFSEFFGYRGSLDETSLSKDKLFYGFFLIQIFLGLVVMYFPNTSLFQITLLADFFNGMMLPLIFFFLYKIANDREIMGEYQNTKLQNILLVGSGIVISIGTIIGGLGHFFGI